jgi:hypothetical protein
VVRALEPWHLLVLLFMFLVVVAVVGLVLFLARSKASTPLASRPGQVPPGWYPDATSPGNLRYWDGSAWTEHRRPAG